MKDLAHLKRPLNLIVIGMAGSGKSTFLGKLQMYLTEVYHALPFMVNLDPAVSFLPFSPGNDIRSEVNYKDVMSKYSLGPNGAIMTSLNLYAAKFHLTLDKMEEQHQFTKYSMLTDQTVSRRHARTDRGVHLVCIWTDHHHDDGICVSHSIRT